ncbi:unnamed protein product [Rotaria sordida]|uniref:PPM-type phosphatase domain-containing protein n=1 Tax=Rotaria sordida TaxID=392033 RepID=A0A815WKA0_9BILA|nr:unnamed protein product [Rotaria sordida]CAF1541935.1 unnamed protein product [Rotaria sordida]
MSFHDDTDNVHPSVNDLYLDQPCTKKELYGNESFGFGSMQGWRRSQEDSAKHLIPFDNHLWKNWSYYAIFDGHNGVQTAKNAADLLDNYLIQMFKRTETKMNDDQFDEIIKKTFIQLDKHLSHLVRDHSGSVCIASLIGPKNIFLINVGDSRAIIISKDGQVLASTKDHKPTVKKEQERIRKAGGHLTQSPGDVLRVENQLAMTRVLGDYSLDKNIIPAVPDIIQYVRDSSAAYLILACDGIWDVMDNEQVAKFVSERIPNTALDNIISQLFDQCLQKESSDNMTAYIVQLDRN